MATFDEKKAEIIGTILGHGIKFGFQVSALVAAWNQSLLGIGVVGLVYVAVIMLMAVVFVIQAKEE